MMQTVRDWLISGASVVREIHPQEKRIMRFEEQDAHKDLRQMNKFDLIRLFESEGERNIASKYFPIVNALGQELNRDQFVLVLLLVIRGNLPQYLSDCVTRKVIIGIIAACLKQRDNNSDEKFIVSSMNQIDIALVAMEILLRMHFVIFNKDDSKNRMLQEMIEREFSDVEIIGNVGNNQELLVLHGKEEEKQMQQQEQINVSQLPECLGGTSEQELLIDCHTALVGWFMSMQSVEKTKGQKIYYYLTFLTARTSAAFSMRLFAAITSLFLRHYDVFLQVSSSFAVKFEDAVFHALYNLGRGQGSSSSSTISPSFFSEELQKFYILLRRQDRFEYTFLIIFAFMQVCIREDATWKDVSIQCIEEFQVLLTEELLPLSASQQEEVWRTLIWVRRINSTDGDAGHDYLLAQIDNIIKNKCPGQLNSTESNFGQSLMSAMADEQDYSILKLFSLENLNAYTKAIMLRANNSAQRSNNELTFLFRLLSFYGQVFALIDGVDAQQQISILTAFENVLTSKSAYIFAYQKIVSMILCENFVFSRMKILLMVLGITAITFKEKKECRAVIQKALIAMLQGQQSHRQSSSIAGNSNASSSMIEFERVKYSLICNAITHMYTTTSRALQQQQDQHQQQMKPKSSSSNIPQQFMIPSQIYSATKKYREVQQYSYPSVIPCTMVFDNELLKIDDFTAGIFDRLCSIAVENTDSLLLKELLTLMIALLNRQDIQPSFISTFKRTFCKLFSSIKPFHLNQILLIATKGEYFPIYSKVFNKPQEANQAGINSLNPIHDFVVINKQFEEIYFERMSFIHIREHNFLDIYFKYLEFLTDSNLIKKYFLNVVYALAKNSFENTIFFSKPKVFQSILSCLACESDLDNRKLFLNLAQVNLQEGVNAHHVKSITQQILLTSHGEYFYRMLNESIRLMEDVINEQNSLSLIPTYYYFKGGESFLMLDEKIPWIESVSRGMTILTAIKLESINNFIDSVHMKMEISKVLPKQDTLLCPSAVGNNSSSGSYEQPQQCLFSIVSEDNKKLSVFFVPIQKTKRVQLKIVLTQNNSMSIEMDFDYASFSEVSRWHTFQLNYNEKSGIDGFQIAFNGNLRKPLSTSNRKFGKIVESFKVVKLLSIGADIAVSQSPERFCITGQYFNGFVSQFYVFSEYIEIEKPKIKLQDHLVDLFVRHREKIIMKLNTHKDTLSSKVIPTLEMPTNNTNNNTTNISTTNLSSSAQSPSLLSANPLLASSPSGTSIQVSSSSSSFSQSSQSSTSAQSSSQAANPPPSVPYTIIRGDNREESVMLQSPICLTYAKARRNVIQKTLFSVFSLSKNDISSKTEFNSYAVNTKGLRYLEFSHFLEALLSIGNVEVFIYILDLLISNTELRSEQKLSTASAVFQLMSSMIQQDLEIIQFFDSSSGILILKMLIKALIKENKGCSIEFVESVKQFVDIGFPFNDCSGEWQDEQMEMTSKSRQTALEEIFFCWSIWSQCSFKVQRSVLIFSLSQLEIDSNYQTGSIAKIILNNNNSLVQLFSSLHHYFNSQDVQSTTELKDLQSYLLKIITAVYQIFFHAPQNSNNIRSFSGGDNNNLNNSGNAHHGNKGETIGEDNYLQMITLLLQNIAYSGQSDKKIQFDLIKLLQQIIVYNNLPAEILAAIQSGKIDMLIIPVIRQALIAASQEIAEITEKTDKKKEKEAKRYLRNLKRQNYEKEGKVEVDFEDYEDEEEEEKEEFKEDKGIVQQDSNIALTVDHPPPDESLAISLQIIFEFNLKRYNVFNEKQRIMMLSSIESLDSLLPQKLPEETFTLLIEYLNKSLLEGWRIEKTLLEIFFTRVSFLLPQQQLMVLNDIRKVLAFLYDRQLNAKNQEYEDSEFDAFMHKLVINPQFIQIVENILYIFLDDPQAAKIKETTATELLDYLINFLIVHEIDGAKLIKQLIQAQIHQHFHKFISILQLQLAQVKGSECVHELLPTQRGNLIELFFYLENILRLHPGLVSQEEQILQKVIKLYIDFFGNTILILQRTTPQIRKELEGKIEVATVFAYLEEIVNHKRVGINGGILRAVVDMLILCFQHAKELPIRCAYISDLNVLLVMSSEMNGDDEGQKQPSSKGENNHNDVNNNNEDDDDSQQCQSVDLVKYRNEAQRDIFREYLRDYLFAFGLREYWKEPKSILLKEQLLKMILNAVHDGMHSSWTNLNGAIIENDYGYNMQESPYSNLCNLIAAINGKQVVVTVPNPTTQQMLENFFSIVKEIRISPGLSSQSLDNLRILLQTEEQTFKDQILPIIDNYIVIPLEYIKSISSVLFKLHEQVLEEAKREKASIFYCIHSQSQASDKQLEKNIERIKEELELAFARHEQAEYEQLTQTLKIWKTKKKRLVSERGLWYEENPQDKIKWKINKIEDNYRRKFFLKRDKKWLDKKFFTDPKYQKKQAKMIINSNSSNSANANNSIQSISASKKDNENQAFFGENNLNSLGEFKPTPDLIKQSHSAVPVSFDEKVIVANRKYSEQPAEDEIALDKAINRVRGNSTQSTGSASSASSSTKIATVDESGIEITIEAEQITQTGVVYGELLLSSKGILTFVSKDPKTRGSKHWGCLESQLINEPKTKVIPIKNLRQAMSRRYLYKEIALELFTDDHKVYFFNTYSQSKRDSILNSIRKLSEGACLVVINRKSEFPKQLKEDWRRGKVSNFEYLMHLNSYSGRSFNDLGQYPVFPWVLKDFKSPELNLEDENIYRQLSMPIGAINRQRFENHYLARFQHSSPSDPDTYFMYGTHYSNATIVLTLLMRMEPFAGLHFAQQSNKFDHADRLFHSVQDCWESGQVNSADVKELIPEFYYLPDFLYNVNELFLGKKQDNTEVDGVILPEWIKKSTDTPEEFVFRMRQALESPSVSKNLHLWIDLIFGSKQYGQKAIEAENLFHPSSYCENFNIRGMTESELTAEKAKMTYFGQTPYRLFDDDQKGREEGTSGTLPKIKHFEFFNKINPRYQKALGIDASLEYVTANQRYVALMEKEANKYILSFFKCKASLGEKDFTSRRGKLEIKKSPELLLRNSIQLYDHFVLTIAHGDKNILVKSAKDEKYELNVDSYHKKILTCLSVCEGYAACGSRDCRVSVYKISRKKTLMIKPEIDLTFLKMLYGHHNDILAIKLDPILSLIISIDSDGLGLIHELKTQKFLHSFKLPELQDGELPQFLEIHQSGFILILTTLKTLFIFTMNGNLYLESSLSYLSSSGINDERITDVKFLSDLCSYIYLSTNKGSIYYLDLFEIKAKSKINATPRFQKFQENTQPITAIFFHQYDNQRSLLYSQTTGEFSVIQEKDKAKNALTQLKQLGIEEY